MAHRGSRGHGRRCSLAGRNNAVQNLRYIHEATAGYHFDALHGINVEGGIFMSYVGLESYLLAENWNYQRSVVCEHTPFYFQGMRVQTFPSDRVCRVSHTT